MVDLVVLICFSSK
jgi:hypothetical protein